MVEFTVSEVVDGDIFKVKNRMSSLTPLFSLLSLISFPLPF